MGMAEFKDKLGERGKNDGKGFNKSSGTTQTTHQGGDGRSWQGKEKSGVKYNEER